MLKAQKEFAYSNHHSSTVVFYVVCADVRYRCTHSCPLSLDKCYSSSAALICESDG